jgi:hypothetical protein
LNASPSVGRRREAGKRWQGTKDETKDMVVEQLQRESRPVRSRILRHINALPGSQPAARLSSWRATTTVSRLQSRKS